MIEWKGRGKRRRRNWITNGRSFFIQTFLPLFSPDIQLLSRDCRPRTPKFQKNFKDSATRINCYNATEKEKKILREISTRSFAFQIIIIVEFGKKFVSIWRYFNPAIAADRPQFWGTSRTPGPIIGTNGSTLQEVSKAKQPFNFCWGRERESINS